MTMRSYAATIAGVRVERSPAEFLRGAHHPHCARHSHHLIWVAGRPLCLGCTCLGLGLVLGAMLGPALARASNDWAPWLAIHAAMTAPTAAQPWVQAKPFKVAARTLVGVASGSYGVGLLMAAPLPEPRLIAQACLGALFLASFAFLLWLRARRPDNPCVGCPEGAFPTCDWNLPRLLGAATANAVHLPISGQPISPATPLGPTPARNRHGQPPVSASPSFVGAARDGRVEADHGITVDPIVGDAGEG